MPGKGSYGPAGKWIHDRAHGIMEDGKTPKDVAYAVATQQAHAVGKSPKDFRTSEGVREAKAKYDEPKKMDKTAKARVFAGKVRELFEDRINKPWLQKKASEGGQDLRTPFEGGTDFPTDDSKVYTNSLLDKSQTKAEVGPAPSEKRLAGAGPTIQELTPKMPTSKGSLPKLGSVYADDPLVRYMRKHADQLLTNIDKMEVGCEPPEAAAEPTGIPTEDAKHFFKGQNDELAALFSNYTQSPPKE